MILPILSISANFILDPYFYQEFAENGNLRSVTVNGAQYCEMLEDYVIPQLAEMEVLDDAIWMQDGVPVHTKRVVTDLLRREFGNNRVISRRFPLAWPAHSPILTPCDFLWGYLKSLVYRQPPRTMLELRQSIANAVRSIPPELLRKAVCHNVDRMQLITDNSGGHIEQLLNR